jgi:hypothetical protein
MPLYHPQLNRKKKVKEGAAMTLKGGMVYAFKGGNTGEFWLYNPEKDSWYGKDTIPREPDRKRVKGGGSLATFGDDIWALKGNNTTSIWKWSGGEASLLSLLPDKAVLSEAKGPKEKWGLEIRTNPLRTPFNLFYTLLEKGVAELSIYNSLGELVYKAKSDRGQFTIRGLPSGIYILRLKSKGYKEERKIVVVR